VEVLKPKVPVRRMVFHEITREAIQRALGETRAIDARLRALLAQSRLDEARQHLLERLGLAEGAAARREE